LLEELQDEVLKRETVEYALDKFDNHLMSAFSKLTNQMAHMRERKQKLEGELRRLTATAAETGPSSFLVAAIHEREQQLREITDQLLVGGADSVDAHLSEIRGFITKRLGDLQQLISGEPAEARRELVKHVSEIRMFPQDTDGDGNGKSHYVAEGTWHLVGGEEETGAVMSPQIRSVADPGNQNLMYYLAQRGDVLEATRRPFSSSSGYSDCGQTQADLQSFVNFGHGLRREGSIHVSKSSLIYRSDLVAKDIAVLCRTTISFLDQHIDRAWFFDM
jgi:hypothetical protein